MHSISLTFHAPGASIPLQYQHALQGMIYRLLHQETGEDWHQRDFEGDGHRYKLFTFSSLRGRKTIHQRHMVFDSLIYLDIRGVSDDFCLPLLTAFHRLREMGAALNLLGVWLKVVSVSAAQPVITQDTVRIRMLSPVTLHYQQAMLNMETGERSARTVYISPSDDDFSPRINANFQRKYKAWTGNAFSGDIAIQPVAVTERDKFITTFKGTVINAWRGEYELSGGAEALTFLYYCGLGDRNSEGFGMYAP